MAVVERLSEKEQQLIRIFKNPILFGEFLHEIDSNEEDLRKEVTDIEQNMEFTIYQKELLVDTNPYVSLRASRAVGKTFAIVHMIIWILFNNLYPGEYIIYSVPNKAQLDPVWEMLKMFFRTNSLLKNFVNYRSGINNSEHRIETKAHATLMCRIAGQSGKGENVIGLHTPFFIVDESGYYPWGTWLELQATINYWMSGSKLIVSGVPTGIREENVNYHADKNDDTYSRYRINSYQNPRFDKEAEEDAIRRYGGKNTEEFAHFVLGQHGSPIYAVFDRRLMDIQSYPVYKIALNGITFGENFNDYLQKVQILPAMPKNNGVIFGVDLGYTEPTAIFIMYLDDNMNFKFHSKIRLVKVPYPIQKRFIDALDTKYNPSLIGMDEGHAGMSVIQDLLKGKQYQKKNYENYLIPIKFNSAIILGVDEDGKEIKSRAKPLSVSLLQEYTNKHRIIYSTTDMDTVTELERMSYTKNPTTGIISYKTMTPTGGHKGEDHFTASLLSGVLAYYLTNESLDFRNKQVKLLGTGWL